MDEKVAVLERKLAELLNLLSKSQPSSSTTLQSNANDFCRQNIPLPKPLIISEGDLMVNFNFFKMQWNNYLIASGANAQTEEVKKSILLSAIGDECLKMYTNFPLTENDRANADNLLNAIERHLTPTVNKRYERAVFNMAEQEQDESYDIYINRLRSLIKNCQYGALEDDILLDIIICSIKSHNLREQLWNDRDITLEQAIQKCKSKELTRKQLQNITSASSYKTEEVNKMKANKYKSQQKSNKNPTNAQTLQKEERDERSCYFCDTKHPRGMNSCPAKGATCFKCGKKNHYSSVCRSRKQEKFVREVNEQEKSDSNSDEEQLLKISSSKSEIPTAKIEFRIPYAKRVDQQKKYKGVECMLDTGAT